MFAQKITGNPVNVMMVSPDVSFVKTITTKLRRWLSTKTIWGQIEHIPPAHLAGSKPEIIFLDVRTNLMHAIYWLKTAKKVLPFSEVIIVTENGNIEQSMKGMRAGASDEITIPIDTALLRSKIKTAITRINNRAVHGNRRDILRMFQESMSVASFAEEEGFTTAIDLLSSPTGQKNNQKEKL